MEQTNQYIKQFPELFKGKKIMYVHGFGSSGQSGTVTRIREVFPNTTVIAPDIPIHPEEAITMLRQLADSEQPDLIIGTSMGGMYAEQLNGFDRILINPAFQIADTMQEHGMTGKQQFQNPRLDGIQEFYVDKPLVKEYRTITGGNFAHAADTGERQRIYGLFGDKDDLVHTRELYNSHYPQAISFHGEHRMNDHSFMHSVVPIIRWIDDRQEKRERPIIYIDVNTLMDQWNKPRSSSQKAVRTLLETYQLFFVAPASNVPLPYSNVLSWLDEYINVPAWNHTVFTNQKHLLYGDYLIDAEKTEGMATPIEFGSDTFKTWDDIIEYFSRLGGQ